MTVEDIPFICSPEINQIWSILKTRNQTDFYLIAYMNFGMTLMSVMSCVSQDKITEFRLQMNERPAKLGSQNRTSICYVACFTIAMFQIFVQSCCHSTPSLIKTYHFSKFQ